MAKSRLASKPSISLQVPHSPRTGPSPSRPLSVLCALFARSVLTAHQPFGFWSLTAANSCWLVSPSSAEPGCLHAFRHEKNKAHLWSSRRCVYRGSAGLPNSEAGSRGDEGAQARSRQVACSRPPHPHPGLFEFPLRLPPPAAARPAEIWCKAPTWFQKHKT